MRLSVGARPRPTPHPSRSTAPTLLTRPAAATARSSPRRPSRALGRPRRCSRSTRPRLLFRGSTSTLSQANRRASSDADRPLLSPPTLNQHRDRHHGHPSRGDLHPGLDYRHRRLGLDQRRRLAGRLRPDQRLRVPRVRPSLTSRFDSRAPLTPLRPAPLPAASTTPASRYPRPRPPAPAGRRARGVVLLRARGACPALPRPGPPCTAAERSSATRFPLKHFAPSLPRFRPSFGLFAHNCCTKTLALLRASPPSITLSCPLAARTTT